MLFELLGVVDPELLRMVPPVDLLAEPLDTVGPVEPFWAGVDPDVPLPVLLLPDAVDWACKRKLIKLSSKALLMIIFFILLSGLDSLSSQTSIVAS